MPWKGWYRSLTMFVIGGLDIDRGDVVREEDDLIGVQLARILVRQGIRRDKPALQ